MKLNASVNGGTFQAPMKTLASAACRIVEKNAPTTIQTITSRPSRAAGTATCPAPTRTPLKPNSPARIAPRSIPISDRGERRDGEPERAGEAEPRLADEHRDEDREPRDRVVHEADLPDAAQAGVDEGEQRVAVRPLGPAGHRPVDRQLGARAVPTAPDSVLAHSDARSPLASPRWRHERADRGAVDSTRAAHGECQAAKQRFTACHRRRKPALSAHGDRSRRQRARHGTGVHDMLRRDSSA